jgi:steroid delta-isomerase-like uncharacterized protein
MTTEETKGVARRYMERLDQRDLDGLVTMYTPAMRFHGLAAESLDAVGVRQAMAKFFAAFPDARMPVHDMVAEGETVAIRHSFRGTHRKEFQGIPPTGRQVAVPAIVILRLARGKVDEGHLIFDAVGLLQQLGVMPQAA